MVFLETFQVWLSVKLKKRLTLNPKRIDAALFVALLALGSCTVTEDNPVVDPVQQQKSIVILYENDVHCGIDGYAKLAGLRDAIAAADTSWVGVTSSGDFLNGDVAGAISRGQYIVDIMRHVGSDSHTLISKTRGIDVVLDGHTHAVVSHDEVNNLDGKPIGVTQTGTQFANIGKLLITTDGRFYTSLIPASELSPADANSPVTAATETVKTKLAQQTEEVLGTCDFELTINGADGKRLVRNGGLLSSMINVAS